MGGGEPLPDTSTSQIEHETLDSCSDGDDDIPESFRCPVCLDLLYKPVVLACGHTSCFWCVRKGMSSLQESHCALCRCPYNHFPGICLLLHFLLLKIYPAAYKRREKQVLEEEKEADCFSPQFDDNAKMERVYTSKSNSCTIVEPSDCNTSCHYNVATVPEKSYSGNFGVKGDTFLEKGLENGTCKQASVFDVLCAACKQLLVRPVVLNCGHVYCESCLVNPQNDMLRCQLCQSLHPGGFPKVFLVLDHFLEEQFCEEYTKRRVLVQPGQLKFQHGSSSACTTQVEKQITQSSCRNDPSWWEENWSQVHFGVGCDSCGVVPIIGKRYKCKDCIEAIGFDLCEVCYNTCTKLPGRFNQKHTSEHNFELVQTNNLLIDLMADLSEDSGHGFAVPLTPADVPQDRENPDPAI